MQKFLDDLYYFFKTINDYLSDYVLVFLLLSVGILFTIKTRFVQVRCFKEGFVTLFGKNNKNNNQQKGVSTFQAFTTAVASQVGTGNIVGVSGAILTGGPGAIFWMWIIAFFGMATAYSEAVLAQKTRVVSEDGSFKGGPVYYIKQAFKGKFGKFLSLFFSVACVFAVGFVGGMVQSNSIGEAVGSATGVPPYVIGIIISVLILLVLIGGVKRIASVTEKLVPVMAIFYIVGSIVILAFNVLKLPEAIFLIFKYAFSPQAIIGGGFGYAIKVAISQGAKRGLFSNEAGMGTTPHAHALANIENPHKQGTVAIISVFLDTFVVLSLTALVIISSLYTSGGALSSGVIIDGIYNTNLVSFAIKNVFGGGLTASTISAYFIAICLTFFAFSTIIGWNLFGRINFEYLFGKKSVIVYILISVTFVFLGSFLKSNLVWQLTDFFNYLMVIPNVFALFKLNKVVTNELRENGPKNKKLYC